MTPKTIRFGIVGTGSIVEQFLQAAREHDSFQAVALYSRSQDHGTAFAHSHGIAHYFPSLEEMAASPGIDAVYLASPNALHASQAITFLRHKKHVLCEKALAANAVEARAMFDTASENGVILMEAMKTTVLPNFLAIREALPLLGTVRRYFASYCQYSSRYDKFKAGIVENAFNPAMASGALMDIGVYTLAPLISLFGPPTRVQAQGTLLSNGIDGQGSVLLSYPSMEAVVQYSKVTSSATMAEIQGEEGMLLIDAINVMGTVDHLPRKGPPRRISEAHRPRDMYYEVNEFIRTIHECKKESSLNTRAVSLAVMDVMDEVRRQVGVHFQENS